MMLRYLTTFSRRCCTKFKAVYRPLLLLLTLNFFLILLYFYLSRELRFEFTKSVETPSSRLTPPTTTTRSSLSLLKQQRGSTNVISPRVLHKLSGYSYSHARTIYIVELLCAFTVTCCSTILALLILPFRFKTNRELRSPKKSNNAGISSKNSLIGSKEFQIGGHPLLVTVMELDSDSVLISMAHSSKDVNGQPILRTCSSVYRKTVPLQTHFSNGKEATTPSLLTEYDELKARYSPCKAGDSRMKESDQRVKNKKAPVNTQYSSLKAEIKQLNAMVGAKNAEIQDLASTVKTLASIRKSQSRDAEIRALNGIIETLLTNI